MADQTDELISLNQRLLDAIDQQDWATYADLCDPELTAFEPEAVGQLVTGMDFHRFYFQMETGRRERQSTIVSPHVHLLGEVAVVTYVRLLQRVEEDGHSSTSALEETRIWQRQDGTWKHVHFHRSPCGHVRL